jgi:hypothetical protein
MERATTADCGKCHQPIVSGEGFVRFKIPGERTYRFFHSRFRMGDCWEGQLHERK